MDLDEASIDETETYDTDFIYQTEETTDSDESFIYQYDFEINDTFIVIFEVDDEQNVTKWLLKKQAKAVSGTIVTEQLSFGAAEKYKRVALENSPVLEIISVTDSDNNKYHEQNYLVDFRF